MAYSQPIDIMGVAQQHLGTKRSVAFTDVNSKSAQEIAFAYDKMRAGELEQNLWKFATRSVVLRAVGVDTQTFAPPAWAAGTFSVGSVVAFTPVSGPYIGEKILWETNAAKTSGNTLTPDLDPDWTRYLGPSVVDLWNTGSSGNTTLTYTSNELVLVPAVWNSGTTYAKNDVVYSGTTVYVSLTAANLNNVVSDTTHWVVWTATGRSTNSYGITASKSPIPLTFPGTPSVYRSLYNSNADNPLAATGNWLNLNVASVARLNIIYPLGSGPLHQSSTSYAYRLPSGYLRRAPTAPKEGLFGYLGATSGSEPEDIMIEDQYIVTRDSGPIFVRYVGDVIDVNLMDSLFCEGLAAKCALQTSEPILQDVAKSERIERAYKGAISRARANNMIEIGPITMPENRYVTVRR